MYSIRALADNVAPLADEQDKSALHHLIQGLTSALDLDARDVAPATNSEAQSQPAPSTQGNPATVAPPPPKATISSLLKNASEYAKTDPQKLWRYFKHLDSCIKRMPSAPLLRSGLLITLISHLDALIASLMRYFYRAHPEALPAQEASISLEELRTLGSIASAEEYILERHINTRLYASFSDQLKYFSSQLKVPPKCLDSHLESIIETIQRRHVHVHNAGVANRQYLTKVAPSLLSEYQAKDGTYLIVDEKYLRRAIDRIHMAGLLLTQQCWRQWNPTECQAADGELNKHIFDTITEERYVLAQNLGKYALSVKYATDKDRQFAILNLAQAYKWNQQPDEMTNVISQNDWSSASLLVQLALSALNDDKTAFFNLLPRVLASQELDNQSLHEWPIFKTMRAEPQFPVAS
jgi:hypothetical protein